MRLFLDANVLFTPAHNRAGRAAALFALSEQAACALVTSRHAVEEARRNLRLKYPGVVTVLDDLLQKTAIQPEATPADVGWAMEQGLPLSDAPILAAAAGARADMLVTGDRTHFGKLYGRRLRGVEIASPADALARVLASR